MKAFLHLSKHNKANSEWVTARLILEKGNTNGSNKSMIIGTGSKNGKDYPAQICIYSSFKFKIISGLEQMLEAWSYCLLRSYAWIEYFPLSFRGDTL